MKKLFILLLTALIFLGGAGLAFAQGYGVDIKNPLQSLAGNSKDLIVAISTYILNVIAGLGALVLIYAGILFVTSSGKIVPAMLVRWKANTPILRLRQNIRPALSSEQQALIDALGARKSLLEKGPLLFRSPEGELWDSLDKQILGINPRPGMQRNLFAADPASVVFSKPASPTVVPVPQIEGNAIEPSEEIGASQENGALLQRPESG